MCFASMEPLCRQKVKATVMFLCHCLCAAGRGQFGSSGYLSATGCGGRQGAAPQQKKRSVFDRLAMPDAADNVVSERRYWLGCKLPINGG